MIVTAAHAYSGRLVDLTIREWLTSHASAISKLPYVLISSIDSDRQVSSMPWARARILEDRAWALSPLPLVISGASAVSLLDDQNLFTGFDELWIPAELPATGPPDEASLVAPLELDIESPAAIWAWLEVSQCRLGVGDGYGTNYVVADPALGRSLGLDRASPHG